MRVLATKTSAGETAISAASAAMRVTGGTVFFEHLSLGRHIRDAQAVAVAASTSGGLREFIRRASLKMELF